MHNFTRECCNHLILGYHLYTSINIVMTTELIFINWKQRHVFVVQAGDSCQAVARAAGLLSAKNNLVSITKPFSSCTKTDPELPWGA